MRRIITIIIIIMSAFLCININASTLYKYVPEFTNNYLKRFNSYSRYFVTTDAPYGYEANEIINNNNYKLGGLLNKDEFLHSMDSNGNTYLFNGLEYWTMTKSDINKTYAINPISTARISEFTSDRTSGIRTTEYVQNKVYLKGKGTSSDPWTFVEKYYVTFVYDDSKIAMNPRVAVAPYNGAIVSSIINNKAYTYASNDCGAELTIEKKLKLENVKKDITCHITTALAEHTLTYNPEGYCTPSTKKVKHNNAIGTMCTPTKEGYTFDGWYDEEIGGTQVIKTTKLMDDMDLYARFEANTYTLTYDNNGGSGCNSLQQEYDEEWGALCEPARTGYTFDGWYSSPIGGAKIIESTKVTGDRTVHAHWTANKFTIEYNGNGNTSGTTSSHVCEYDADCFLLDNGFVKAGNIFTGWKKNNNGDIVSANSNVKNAATSGTVIYHAQWTEKTATLTYNANGHGTAPSNVTMKYTATTNAASAISATGYVFNKWNTKSDGTGTSYNAGAQVKAANVEPSAMTLYAIWYTNPIVTFNCNGGTGSMNNQTVVYNTNTALTANGCSRSGYTFTKWNTAANGSGTSYTNQANIKITSNTTLYAQWTEKTATLTYNANGHGTAPSNVTMKYTAATNAASAISVTGYVFNKWNTKSDGTGTSYNAGAQVKAANVEPSATTLYAIWYTNPIVTFNCNGGTGSMSNQTVVYNTNTALTANGCSRSGYTFTKWNTAANGSGTSYTNQSNIKTTSNTTLYAQWKSNKVTVTYKCNGGLGPEPTAATIDSGSAADLSSRSCNYKITVGSDGHVYYMIGWNTDSKATTAGTYKPTSDITVYAVWAELFTYSSPYYVYADGSGNWRLEMRGTGILTINGQVAVDIHAVGGGGGGSNPFQRNYGGSGGGGGKTATAKNKTLAVASYTVTIGAGGAGNNDSTTTTNDGGTSSLKKGNTTILSADGGKGALKHNDYGSSDGGSGGSGGGSGSVGQTNCIGVGGSDGNNGSQGSRNDYYSGNHLGAGGTGQGRTTRDFGESGGTLRAGGGGGGCGYGNLKVPFATIGSLGGDVGGGNGGQWGSDGDNGLDNYGGGGGGGGSSDNEVLLVGAGGAGGTGIVIIRNKR